MVRIAHLGDIHVQDRRRDEYAIIFARLYESLKLESIDIIVVAGDVFDNKMRASPHNLEDVASFLSKLVTIAPVILIAGNHDTNCLIPGSLDLLTPLISNHRALQPPYLTYWRNSGIYTAHGIKWTVIATDGKQPEDAHLIEYQQDMPHICLFHEEVNGALLPNGQLLSDFKLSKSNFIQYDLTLGGHIHLRQCFTNRAAYCGSLIQQNIGELHNGHGYILWDLQMSSKYLPYKTSLPIMRGIDILNDKGFVRIEVNVAGNDVTVLPLPKSPHYWELIYDEDAPSISITQISTLYETMFGMQPRTLRARPRTGIIVPNVENNTDEQSDRMELISAQIASRTISSHEEIIRELLTNNENLEDIIDLHKKRWGGPKNYTSGGKFRILRLEFDNMYAFGPSNVIDFTKLEGCVSGIIAPNHTGKSSFIETLLFALYENYPRAPSKKDIIHNGAASCKLVIEFELDGKPGRIVKSFNHGNTRHESLYRFEFAGENRTKGGTPETLAEIEQVLGGVENALASSFQLQGGESGGFIGSTPACRKKIIAAVMTLGSFEELEKVIATELTESGAEVKIIAAQYHGISASDLEYKLDVENGDLDDRAVEIKQLSSKVLVLYKDHVIASQELGITIGENKYILTAAESAKNALNSIRTVNSIQECNTNLAIWNTIVGELSVEESNYKPSFKNICESKVLTVDIIASASEIENIHKNITKTENNIAINKFQLCNLVKIAKQTQIDFDQVENITKFTTANFKPNVQPPEFPRQYTNVIYENLEERSGVRPSDITILDAIKLLTENVNDEDKIRALTWNLSKFTDLKESVNGETLESATILLTNASENLNKVLVILTNMIRVKESLLLSESPTNVQELTNTKQAVEIATATYNKIAIALAAEGYRAADAAKKYPHCTYTDVQQTAEVLKIAHNSNAASVYMDTFRSKLIPQVGCIGCNQTVKLLSEDIEPKNIHEAEEAHDRALSYNYQILLADLNKAMIVKKSAINDMIKIESEIELKLISDKQLISIEKEIITTTKTVIEAEQIKKDAILLITKIKNLSEAHINYVKYENINKATTILEIAKYWSIRDAEEWDRYDTNYAIWHAEFNDAAVNHEKLQCLKRNIALQQLTAANQNVLILETSHVIAENDLNKFQENYQQQISAYNQMVKQRKEAIAAFLWWKEMLVDTAKVAELQVISNLAEKDALISTTKISKAKLTASLAEQSYRATTKHLEFAQQQDIASAREISRLSAEIKFEHDRSIKYQKAVKRQAILKAYRAILRPNGGIGDHLLERGRAAITRCINAALLELGARFIIEITPEYDVKQCNADSINWLPASLGSGYQKFVLSLAARLAIWRLSTSPRPDAFIIDEGFGSCDDEYLELMATALEALADAPGGPRLVFLVSHVDALKSRISRVLEINIHATGSRLVNSSVSSKTVSASAVVSSKKVSHDYQANILHPDPENVNNVYCNVCNQSIKAAWSARHLASNKHESAIKKKSTKK